MRASMYPHMPSPARITFQGNINNSAGHALFRLLCKLLHFSVCALIVCKLSRCCSLSCRSCGASCSDCSINKWHLKWPLPTLWHALCTATCQIFPIPSSTLSPCGMFVHWHVVSCIMHFADGYWDHFIVLSTHRWETLLPNQVQLVTQTRNTAMLVGTIVLVQVCTPSTVQYEQAQPPAMTQPKSNPQQQVMQKNRMPSPERRWNAQYVTVSYTTLKPIASNPI